MSAWLDAWWPYLVTAVASAATIAAACHAVLTKREVRSAAAWVGLILLVPALGAVLYFLLGINRIARRASRVRADMLRYAQGAPPGGLIPMTADTAGPLVADDDAHLLAIARVLDRTTRFPLAAGNRIRPLRDGDEAYPAMIEAIEGARRSVALVTYIFDDDPAGRRFVDALAAARARGVEVRVLIDDAGARYSWPSIVRRLRRRGVRVARFLRVWAPWAAAFLNLRNHRKVLVVDGTIGFTGGMNIRHGCVLAEAPPRLATRDVHFRVDGPVVAELATVFAEDWTFVTGEVLSGPAWFPPLAPAGDALCRGIPDGPDRDLDAVRWTYLAGIASARRAVRIVTPYFLPDEDLIAALVVAARRGVTVEIVLPGRGNLRLVDWAMRGELWKVLRHGCRVWLTPPPFDHAKLMVVDGAWSLIGSPNWDPRSLRLNFELAVECYDRALAAELDAMIDARIASARRLDEAALDAAPWPARLRNGAARLLTPYL